MEGSCRARTRDLSTMCHSLPDHEQTGTGDTGDTGYLRYVTPQSATSARVAVEDTEGTRSINILEPKPPCPVSPTSERLSAAECDFAPQDACCSL